MELALLFEDAVRKNFMQAMDVFKPFKVLRAPLAYVPKGTSQGE